MSSYWGGINWGSGSCPYPWPPYGPPGIPPPWPPPPWLPQPPPLQVQITPTTQPGQVSPAPAQPGQVSPTPQGEVGVQPVSLGLSGQIGDTPTEPVSPQLRTPLSPSVTPEVEEEDEQLLFSNSRRGFPWRIGTEPDRSYLNLHVTNYPTPGMFFDASNPQGRFRFTDVDAFIRAALGSALTLAGMSGSIAASTRGEALRKSLSDAIACGQYNDGLFGTTNVSFVGGRRWVGPHGRGINWQPHHADVHRLISQNQVPFRTTALDGSRLPQFIEMSHRPLVYIPELDLQALQNYQIVPIKLDPPVRVDLSEVRFPGGVGCDRQGVGRTARDWWERR